MSKRAAVKLLIQQYYFQLIEGCGKADCSNPDCASNSSFPKISENEAAAKAITLYTKKSILCEKHPSKHARTETEKQESSNVMDVSDATSSNVILNSTKDGDPSASKHIDHIQVQPDLIVAHGNASMIHGVLPSGPETINKQLKNVSVSESNGSRVNEVQEKENLHNYEEDYDTLYSLEKLLDQPENGTMSRIKSAVWKVFANMDSLNNFALHKEKVKSQEAKDEDKDIDETNSMDTDSADKEPPINSKIIPCVATTSTTALPGNQNCPPPTVNMGSVRDLYKVCSKHTELETVMYNAISFLIEDTRTQLIRKKDLFKDKSNYLNMFVVLMENHSLHNPEAYAKTFPSFCKVMSLLPVKAQAELAKFWSEYDVIHFRNIVESLQQLITIKVVTDFSDDKNKSVEEDDGITSAAKCLNILFYASIIGGEMDSCIDEVGAAVVKKSRAEAKEGNEDDMDIIMHDPDSNLEFQWEDKLAKELNVNRLDSLEPKIPSSEFVNEALNDTIQMDEDYANYKINQHGSTKFSFLHYPFLLNTVSKTGCLFYDNRFRMTSERRRTFLTSFVQGSLIHPYLKIHVRRSHIINDTLVQLELAAEDSSSFKKQLFVAFDGEEGVDEGGVSKEFFQLVVEQIFNPDNGMFILNNETNLFWFNQHSFETQVQYKLIGIVLGLAIYNSCILDINFPHFVYKKLLGRKATFHDMSNSHPLIYRSLNSLLEYEGNVEEDMMITFQIEYSDLFGGSLTHDLKENAANIPVTNENRQEYVDLYTEWLLNTSVAEQFNAFLSGFDLVVRGSPLKYLFQYDELELLIRGSEDYNFRELEKTTEYDGGFEENSLTIKYFWSVAHELSEEDKRKLLQFTTGSDRAPVGGLSKLRLIIAKNGPDSTRLPTAHTCFNVLLLPDYRDLEKLKERLLKAIKYSKGFGML